jgi:predicted transcriptional regulator
MAYQAYLNMGITEYAVSRAIMELQKEHNLISYKMIADRIGGGTTAVGESVKHMMKSQTLIRIEGSSRAGGYRYDYLGK